MDPTKELEQRQEHIDFLRTELDKWRKRTRGAFWLGVIVAACVIGTLVALGGSYLLAGTIGEERNRCLRVCECPTKEYIP